LCLAGHLIGFPSYNYFVMNILEDLLSSIHQDSAVREVIVSTHSTVVCSLRCGMSATTLSTKPHGEEFIHDAGQLHLKSVKELAQLALSENPLEASVGVAAINSIIDIHEDQTRPLDAADMLKKLSQNKNVVIVGHFPFIPQIKATAKNLWVLEQNPDENEHDAGSAKRFVPQADILAITGATLINHTLEGLLSLRKRDAIVMVIGPSTPLSTVMFEHGIDVASGILVKDEGEVVRAVSQGAIFKQMKGIQRLVMVRHGLEIAVT
jgi:uncharacterized protein (DUF4213/DUF364 family)